MPNLVAEYVDRVRSLGGVVPKRTVGAMAKQVGSLTQEGIPEEAIRAGLELAADRGAPPARLSDLVLEASRRAARAPLADLVREHGWPTGALFVRGSHSGHCVYDPLGTDRPPQGWPHPRPTREEVEPIVGALVSIGKFFETSVRA